MSAFDEIIKGMPEETLALLGKHPEIKQGFEKIEAEFTEAVRRVAEWQDFAYGKADPQSGQREGGEFDPQTRTFRRLTEAENRAATAEARAAALEAAAETGADMTFDEILQGLQAKGFVTKTDLEATVKPLVAGFIPKGDHEKAINSLAGAFQHIYANTGNLPVRHRAEFGEDLDFNAFFEHMQKTNSLGDPKAAYDRFVGAKREEVRTAAEAKRNEEWQATLATEKEAARKEGVEAGKKEAIMGQSGTLPVDQSGPPIAMMPHVREQIQKSRQEDGSYQIPADSKLGDGVRAGIAAQLLREGKLGPQQVQ